MLCVGRNVATTAVRALIWINRDASPVRLRGVISISVGWQLLSGCTKMGSFNSTLARSIPWNAFLFESAALPP